MSRRMLMGKGFYHGASAGPLWTKAYDNVATYPFSSPSTFTSVTVNNSSTSNVVVVMISSNNSSLSGVTIGGNAMTQVVQSGGTNNTSSIWQITGNIYTTPNIVISGNLGNFDLGITVGILSNVNVTVPSGATIAKLDGASQSDPYITSSALTVPTSGIVLAVCETSNVAGAMTWANLTAESALSGGSQPLGHHAGHATPSAGSFTPSISGQPFAVSSIAAAVWGP